MIDLLTLPHVKLVRELAAGRRLPLILVGGAVRDAMLVGPGMADTPGASGAPVHDLDFAVQGNAIGLARAVADRLGGSFYLMDAERGTARVIVNQAQGQHFHLDFAVCRGTSWNEDLFGRDFSINAIALDVIHGVILDPTGGQADLPRRLIRQVSRDSVGDDPVRALRAVRLELTLGGTIEPDTLNAVREAGMLLDRCSPERVRDEFMKMLAMSNAARAVRRLDILGLLAYIVPEIEPLRTCAQPAPHVYMVLEHTFVVMDALDGILAELLGAGIQTPHLHTVEEVHREAIARQLGLVTANDRRRVAVFRLAALLHDIGKPLTHSTVATDSGKAIHFYGHEEVGAGMAVARARALRLSSEEVNQIQVTVRNHMRPNLMSRESGQTGPTARAVYRFIHAVGDCAPELALFCMADGMGKAGPATPVVDIERRAAIAALLIQRYYQQFSPAVSPAPLLDGRDVIALGLPQGPRIGQVLSTVREAQMVGEIDSREAALEMARRLIANP